MATSSDKREETIAPAPAPEDYLAKLFNIELSSNASHNTIEANYGPRVAIYAAVNPRLFKMQCKYREFFAGPLVKHAQCAGTMAPLIAHGVPLEPAQTCTVIPMQYYADIFRADTSAIKVRSRALDTDSERVCDPIKYMLNTIHMKPITPPSVGQPIFVTREKFHEKLDKFLTLRSGQPDTKLRGIFEMAGVCTKNLEAEMHNYCIAGGCISKLIDPAASVDDLANSDVDIFIFGDNHGPTIDNLIQQLFVPGETFISVRGSVVSIYRTGAVKVQIISSSYSSPCHIIADFDLASVMTYWYNGTVYANANCVHAFAIRSCAIKRACERFTPERIVKLVRNGFHLILNKNMARRRRVTNATSDSTKLWPMVLKYAAYTRIDANMTFAEKVARIMHHDNIMDVITNIANIDPISASITPDAPAAGPEASAATKSSAKDGDEKAKEESIAPAAPRSADSTEHPIRVSEIMQLKRKISNYTASNLSDIDWNQIDIKNFPTVEGMSENIFISGMKARFVAETIGKLAADPITHKSIYILNPRCSEIFGTIINVINRKLQAVALEPITADVRMADHVAQINVEHLPGHAPHPGQTHTSGSVLLMLRVKCTTIGHYELIIQTLAPH